MMGLYVTAVLRVEGLHPGVRHLDLGQRGALTRAGAVPCWASYQYLRPPRTAALTGAVPCRAQCEERCPSVRAQPCPLLCPQDLQWRAGCAGGQISNGRGLQC